MAAPKGGHYEGMPQLDPAFAGNTIFWLCITMVVIFWILNKIALPRISGIIEDRHTAISNDLDQAAALKQQAVEAEEAYNQALADARSEAARISAETKAEIQAELDVAIAKADAEISAKTAESAGRIDEIRASAMKSVQDVAGDTVGDIVSAVAPVKADAKTLKAAITSRMKGT